MTESHESWQTRKERLGRLLFYPKGQEQVIEELTVLASIKELNFEERRMLDDAKRMLLEYRRNYMRRHVIQGDKV